MESINVKRPIAIKVIMADDFRAQLTSEALETIRRIDDNLKRLEEIIKNSRSQGISGDSDGITSVNISQIEMEKNRLMAMKSELNLRISELEGIQNGAEVPYRVFEGSVDIKVGDNFLDKMSRAELILKDWKVVEIRGF